MSEHREKTEEEEGVWRCPRKTRTPHLGCGEIEFDPGPRRDENDPGRRKDEKAGKAKLKKYKLTLDYEKVKRQAKPT